MDRVTRERCLVSLSDGGSDAIEIREFDFAKHQFVDGGFFIPEAKSEYSWLDADTILLATDFGDDSLTKSGYPRHLKLLKRGQLLAEATLLASVPVEDLSIGSFRLKSNGRYYTFLKKSEDFYSSETCLLDDSGKFVRVPIPEGGELQGLFKDRLLLTTRFPLQVQGRDYKSGSVLALKLADLTNPQYELVFEPNAAQAFSSLSYTANTLYINYMEHVNGKLQGLTLSGNTWQRQEISVPDFSEIGVGADEESDFAFVSSNNFSQVYTESLLRDGSTEPVFFRKSPERFNAENIVTEQHFATSKDGTRVP